MKHFLTLCGILSLLAACKPAETENKAPAPAAPAYSDTKTYTFQADSLTPDCNDDSEIVCAINLSVKCTINPAFSDCAANKAYLPGFIFMEDDNLRRPTTVTYRIHKIKPLEDGSLEVYTASTCDGVWFGLCNGNIIYSLAAVDSRWAVKDLYAVEN